MDKTCLKWTTSNMQRLAGGGNTAFLLVMQDTPDVSNLQAEAKGPLP